MAVLHRRDVPVVLGCLPLAGRFRVSAVREPKCSRIDWAETLAVRSLSAPGIADGGDSPSQHEAPTDDLVLGCVPDDHR